MKIHFEILLPLQGVQNLNFSWASTLSTTLNAHQKTYFMGQHALSILVFLLHGHIIQAVLVLLFTFIRKVG